MKNPSKVDLLPSFNFTLPIRAVFSGSSQSGKTSENNPSGDLRVYYIYSSDAVVFPGLSRKELLDISSTKHCTDLDAEDEETQEAMDDGEPIDIKMDSEIVQDSGQTHELIESYLRELYPEKIEAANSTTKAINQNYDEQW